MIKTILFDLDGTLLPIDTDSLARHYLKAVAAHVSHLVAPALLTELIMASTYKMIGNTDPDLSNAQVFSADFFPKVGMPEGELMPVFDQFYKEKFPKLKTVWPGLPGLAREVVRTAVAKGYEVVLATNPIFPRIAIEERMRWIDVADLPWSLVTVYEEMHACKPQPAYFQEILAKIRRKPSECIMVGNDVVEDGIAKRLGMQVFYITDYLINPKEEPLLTDRSGTLAEFLHLLRDGL